jgi:hypothetical protein
LVPSSVREAPLELGLFIARLWVITGASYVNCDLTVPTTADTVMTTWFPFPDAGGTVHSTEVSVYHVEVAQTVDEMLIVGVASNCAKLKPSSETVAAEVVTILRDEGKVTAGASNVNPLPTLRLVPTRLATVMEMNFFTPVPTGVAHFREVSVTQTWEEHIDTPILAVAVRSLDP